MMRLSRRGFLGTAAAAGAVGVFGTADRPSLADEAPVRPLRVDTRTIEVMGRSARVFGILRPDGGHGLSATAGERFRVRVENRAGEDTLVHWHGLAPPWRQDGVPSLSQPALGPGGAYDYDFALAPAGTHWMHSHHGLQEQRLMAAPLVVRDPAEAGADVQDVVVMLHDFTFRDPAEILAGLRAGAGGHGAAAPDPHAAMGHGPAGAGGHSAPAPAPAPAPVPHLQDVPYDAYLANDRALDDPAVVGVEPRGRVRLRLINAAAATNFWIDLDRLQGTLIAVDGAPVVPIEGRRFEMAVAQRLDIRLDLPPGEGAWPVLAMAEGGARRTGIVLATAGATVSRIEPSAGQPAGAVGLGLERRLRALVPPPVRPVARRHTLTLDEAPGYAWTLGGKAYGDHVPLAVGAGERIEITFVDRTSMAHPMHLHGHRFQVVAIGRERLAGAVRDTVLVPSQGSVTIAFDADNPGRWALHCHHLYHMAAGMMTTVEYA